jgi:hypothetical protein
MFESVLSKAQNYRLWQSGAFGNKLRSWRSIAEWRRYGFLGRVALRCLLAGGGKCVYDLEPREVAYVHHGWMLGGIPKEAITIDEAAPADVVVVQGEYLNGVNDRGDGSFWRDYFYHSRVKKQMRDALREKHDVCDGLVADLVIRRSMTPASYEDWRELLATYPDHVVEVSIYDRCLGDVPHRNALVWEVRRY